jgi:D-arabinose 1-dehydrogenase-like Zn-dependent alcohol dehydrogenase
MLIFKDLTISGSFMASQQETEEMLHAVVDQDVKVVNNIFHGLNEIPRAVEMLKKAEYRGKACFVVDKDAVGVEPGNGYV